MKRILALPFILIIKLYRSYISPLIPVSCRYTPSCSQYGLVAFEKYGLIKGFYLTIKRILSCHPWTKGGFDPVP
ncbi:MAG: putative membrane protein insertion efficiency factor [Candidatus Arcticimaribacter sp.]|jgi:putative membrane protein insertion efficiency factor